LPLVLFPGAGSELYRGLGSVVLGGLVVSTVFTLFLIPTAFTLAVDTKLLVLRMLGRRASEVRVDQWAEAEETPDSTELVATR
jgi:HAE1 family hydrophobic/amphiphilic exporter-1